jgi:hypothetical protein
MSKRTFRWLLKNEKTLITQCSSSSLATFVQLHADMNDPSAMKFLSIQDGAKKKLIASYLFLFQIFLLGQITQVIYDHSETCQPSVP